MTFDNLLDLLTRDGPPRLLALAGPPASGKTTLSERLAAALGPRAQALPMDGFHLDNSILTARGLLHRKGAPETFDAAGFLKAIEALSAKSLHVWPGFDRQADCVVPCAIPLNPDTETFVVEGNYLLLNQPVWRDLRGFWGGAVWLSVDEAVLRERLIRRWRDHGLSDADAETRAEGTDMVNARLILAQSDIQDALIFPGG